MVRPSFHILAIISSAFVAAAANAGSMCYFPDGTQSPSDFVCNSTTGDGFSSCCGRQQDGSQAYCMSNGLCLSDMFVSRGSCTDKDWNSPNCAQVCTKTNPSGGVGVRPCGYTGKWDCGDGSGCGSNAINIPTGTWELTGSQLAAIGAQKADAGKSVPSSGILASPSNVQTVLVTPTGTPDQGVSPGAIGAAVGVPLGILACSFLALWILERRKNNKAKQLLRQYQNNYRGPASTTLQTKASHYSVSHAAAATGGQPVDISRVASKYSTMSPIAQNRQASLTPLDRKLSHSGYPQQPPATVQRAPSSASHLGVHPAYQQEYFGGAGQAAEVDVPPPPPKMYGNLGSASYPAEVEASTFKGHRRGISQVQELPTES